jgi:hypothetical protein
MNIEASEICKIAPQKYVFHIVLYVLYFLTKFRFWDNLAPEMSTLAIALQENFKPDLFSFM